MRQRTGFAADHGPGEDVAQVAPGKRTLTEAIQRSVVRVEGPVQRRAAPPRAGAAMADPFWFAGGPVQASGALEGDAVAAHAARGVAGASDALPHAREIQAAFGKHDVGGVRAQVGGEAASASAAMGATAYATGDRVGFASAPDLHTAAHEAAHVVQQRAGVQLKGGVGEVGDRYEQHADAVADRVVRGESVEALLDELAPAGGGGHAVQRKMGLEMEVGRRVTKSDGSNLEGDDGDEAKMLDHQHFQVVSDHRGGYTNLEFVMKAFDQLAGVDDQAAIDALNLRLDSIEGFYDLIYQDDQERALSALPGVGTGQDDLYRPLPKDPESQDPNAETWSDARIAPTMGDDHHLPPDDDGDEKGMLFCHFTVGYPIDKMFQAMQYLAGEEPAQDEDEEGTPRVYDEDARDRATEAVATANQIAQAPMAQGLNAGELDELKGAIALIYTQLAAFIVKLGGGADGGELGGQIKNMTPVVSRVPLRRIYNSMSVNVQAVLHGHHVAIVQAIADRIQATAAYDANATRHMAPLQAVRAQTYAQSALGRSPMVRQQRVFGGMHELDDVDVDHGMNLIPIEIRQFKQELMTFDEVRTAGADLVRQSRALTLPQQPPAQAPQGPDDDQGHDPPGHGPDHGPDDPGHHPGGNGPPQPGQGGPQPMQLGGMGQGQPAVEAFQVPPIDELLAFLGGGIDEQPAWDPFALHLQDPGGGFDEPALGHDQALAQDDELPEDDQQQGMFAMPFVQAPQGPGLFGPPLGMPPQPQPQQGGFGNGFGLGLGFGAQPMFPMAPMGHAQQPPPQAQHVPPPLDPNPQPAKRRKF